MRNHISNNAAKCPSIKQTRESCFSVNHGWLEALSSSAASWATAIWSGYSREKDSRNGIPDPVHFIWALGFSELSLLGVHGKKNWVFWLLYRYLEVNGRCTGVSCDSWWLPTQVFTVFLTKFWKLFLVVSLLMVKKEWLAHSNSDGFLPKWD